MRTNRARWIAAAGIAWIEYMAWVTWHQPKHLEAAFCCMDSLERRKAEQGSPLYEVLLYYAPCLAARMNAEQGRSYDVDKLVDWCLSENQQQGVPRYGWGTAEFSVPADSAAVIVVAPTGGRVEYRDKRVLIGGVIVDYASPEGRSRAKKPANPPGSAAPQRAGSKEVGGS